MAELRVIALSQKPGDDHLSEQIRQVLFENASRSYYSGKCEMHSMRNDARKYAEIVYLMSVIVEEIGLGGQAQLDQWIQNLREKLSSDQVKMHQERFEQIFQEEQQRFRSAH